MITILFVNSSGSFLPIGKAASRLGVTVRELRNYLIAWETAQWPDNYVINRYTSTFTFQSPDDWNIGSIIKKDKLGRQLIRLNFSMEVGL